MPRPLNVLLLTNLYPNPVQVRHGIFIRERLRYLVEHAGLQITVIAPVPWFPVASSVFGGYGRFAAVPDRERDNGVDVFHPRYVVIPRIGDAITPLTYAAAVQRCIRKNGLGPFDVIDSHFFFPDGAAAVKLGQRLACPVSVTARGSDINVMTNEFFASRWIRWCVRGCDAAVAVSGTLSAKLRELGASDEKLHVIPNGVDADKFALLDRVEVRRRRKLDGPLLISVGNLLEAKGHHLVIDALTSLPDMHLLIVGEGPLRRKLEQQIQSLGLQQRVTMLGEVQQEEMVDYYNAADALVLASAREGMPNVVLEAMCCGTPVVATDVGGLLDFMQGTNGTERIDERSGAGVASAVTKALVNPPVRSAIRNEVLGRNWEETSDEVCNLLKKIAKPIDEIQACEHAA